MSWRCCGCNDCHSKAPQVKWAQRKNCVMLKVEISGAQNEAITLLPDSFTLTATGSDKQDYKLVINTFAEVVPEVRLGYFSYPPSHPLHSRAKARFKLDLLMLSSPRRTRVLTSGLASPRRLESSTTSPLTGPNGRTRMTLMVSGGPILSSCLI